MKGAKGINHKTCWRHVLEENGAVFAGKIIASGKEYRWKVSGKLIAGPNLHLKFQQLLSLPNGLGLRDDATWQ